MTWYAQALLIYLALVNLLAFCLYGLDKGKAKKDKRRIPEATLLLTAVLGGSIGAFLAMRAFRHKTKHKKFTIGVPIIFLCQLAVALLLILK